MYFVLMDILKVQLIITILIYCISNNMRGEVRAQDDEDDDDDEAEAPGAKVTKSKNIVTTKLLKVTRQLTTSTTKLASKNIPPTTARMTIAPITISKPIQNTPVILKTQPQTTQLIITISSIKTTLPPATIQTYPTKNFANSCTKPECMHYKCVVDRNKFAADGLTLKPIGGIWRKICNKIYFFSITKLTWMAANEFCCNMNMTLISVESLEKQNCLTKAGTGILNGVYYVWSSGSDKKCKGNFWWCSINEALSTNLIWKEGNPDNYGGKEDCIVLEYIVKTKNSTVTLMDYECSKPSYFTCEGISNNDVKFSNHDKYFDEDKIAQGQQCKGCLKEESFNKDFFNKQKGSPVSPVLPPAPGPPAPPALSFPPALPFPPVLPAPPAIQAIPPALGSVSSSRNKGKSKATCTKPTCNLSKCNLTEENSNYYDRNGKFLGKNAQLYDICGKKYIFGFKKVNYLDALKYCCEYGSRVVNIETIEEFNCLSNFHKERFNTETSYFTGGTNSNCPQVWYFCRTYTPLFPGAPWLPKQPDGIAKNENALILAMLPKGRTSGFKDELFFSSHNILCESGQTGDYSKKKTQVNQKEEDDEVDEETFMVTKSTSTTKPTIVVKSTEVIKVEKNTVTAEKCSEAICLLDSCSSVKTTPLQQGLQDSSEIIYKAGCGKRFAFGLKKKSYDEAFTFCCYIGMTLVTLETNEKHNCLAGVYKGIGQSQGSRSYWVSATDYGCKGKWTWCTDSESRSKLAPGALWSEAQPSRGWMKDCLTVQLHEEPAKPTGLSDAICVIEQNYPLCEGMYSVQAESISNCPCPAVKCEINNSPIDTKDGKIIITPNVGVIKSVCKRTYLFSKKAKTYVEAYETCCSLNMTLLTYENREEQTCFEDMYKSNFLESRVFWTVGYNCRGSLTWCLPRATTTAGKDVTWRDPVTTTNDCAALSLVTEGEEEKKVGLFPQSCSQLLPFVCRA